MVLIVMCVIICADFKFVIVLLIGMIYLVILSTSDENKAISILNKQDLFYSLSVIEKVHRKILMVFML